MYTGKQLNQGIKQVFLVLLLSGLFCLIFTKLSYFISSVLGAFTLYMLLRNPHKKLVAKGWSKSMATSSLLIFTIVTVFVVGGLLLAVIYNKVKDFHPQIVADNLNNIHDLILQRTGYNIFSKNIAAKMIQSFSSLLPNIFATTGSIITNALMMVFLLYFMLQERQNMESVIEDNLPLSTDSISLLKREARNMVVSNAIGIPLILLGQMLVAGLGYWILGVNDPFVWAIFTGVFGLIPVVGTAGIWLPLAINLFITGNTWQGAVLIIYGALIVSSIDNVIRIFFLRKQADVHPLITLPGIILGMSLFGFWGIIFGPLMISGFLALIKIYKMEFLTN